VKRLIIKNAESIRTKVYQYLRERVLIGEIEPGSRLVEARIAQELGVSRTPVREALHSLEIEKLVRSIPRVGYTVEEMNREELEQLCEIRGLVEGLAVRWAIEKAHKKLVESLLKNVNDQELALEKEDLPRYVELDGQFHDIVAKLSGSQRLLELVQNLRRHMLRYRSQVVYIKQTALRSLHGHRQILKAIKGADTDLALKEMQRHLQQFKQDMLQFVLSEDNQANNFRGDPLRLTKN
jgi:DNA-binding GntR family transcriptional regulator